MTGSSCRAAHEPIITEEVFAKRAALASTRRFEVKDAATGPTQHLLGRLIRCGHCGGNFVGRAQKYTTASGSARMALRYYCHGYLSKGKAVCPSFPLQHVWAEDSVLDAIEQYVVAPDALKEIEAKVRQKLAERCAGAGLDPKSVERKIADIDRRIQHYYKAIGDGLDRVICGDHIGGITTSSRRSSAVLATSTAPARRSQKRRSARSRRSGSKISRSPPPEECAGQTPPSRQVAPGRQPRPPEGFQHLFAEAHRLQAMWDSGDHRSLRALGEAIGVTGERVGQILNLLHLHPEIIEALDVPVEEAPEGITTKMVRGLARVRDREAQLRRFEGMLGEGRGLTGN